MDSGSGKVKRGFGAMSPEVRKAIASKGGKAAHARGTAHEWTSAEAAAAGRKGGRGKPKTAPVGVETDEPVDGQF